SLAFLARARDFIAGPVDARVYALVRMAYALAAFANWVNLWPHRHALFSDHGMIALSSVKTAIRDGHYHSILYLVTSEQGVTFVMLVALLGIACLFVGFGPRLAIGLVFFWHLSYSTRAFPALSSWDAILRIYGLYLLVSPLGRVVSLEGWLWPDPQ